MAARLEICPKGTPGRGPVPFESLRFVALGVRVED